MSNITFVLNHPCQVNGRSTVALVREGLILQRRGSCTLLSMVNCVSFWKECCLAFSVFMGEEQKLCAKSLHTSKWQKNCRFVRESFMLETRGSSNMVSMVNSVCSLKEYWIPLSVFLDDQHHLCVNHPIQVNGRSTASLVREGLVLQARGSCTLLSMLNCVSYWKECCLTFSVFMGEEHKLCAKSTHRSKWEKNCRFVRESLMLEKRGSSNMVSIVNSFCSLKEFCLLFTVFLDKQHHFCAESPLSSEWEKHCSSCKRRINFIIKRVLHLVKHAELC
jgi:hypothetical protein